MRNLVVTLLSYILSIIIPLTATTASARQTDKQIIRFGVYQADKASTMYRRFLPIIAELNRQLALVDDQRQVTFKIFSSYAEGNEALISGQIDFMRLGPASYVKAKQRMPAIRLLAMELVNNKPRFRGVIIVPRQSSITTLAQLRNKSFAFGNANSTIGRYLSQAMLIKAGIYAKDLSHFDYLGRHDKVAYAVGLGDYDAGAVKEKAYLHENKKGTVRSLAYMDNITQPWVVRAGIQSAVFSRLQTSLINIKDIKVLKPLKISGFALSDDAMYDFVRQGIEQASSFDRQQ